MITNLLDKYCRALTPLSEIPVTSNQSMNLGIEVWDQHFHRWGYQWDSIGVTDLADQRLLWVELNKLKNGAVSFEWVIPLFNEPLGVANINPNVLADTPAGSTQVRINGDFTAESFLLPGDMVKLDNHTKVYMVMNDVRGVDPYIEFNCPLKVSLNSTNILQTSNVAMTLIHEPNEDPIEYPREAGDFDAYFTAKFVEKI